MSDTAIPRKCTACSGEAEGQTFIVDNKEICSDCYYEQKTKELSDLKAELKDANEEIYRHLKDKEDIQYLKDEFIKAKEKSTKLEIEVAELETVKLDNRVLREGLDNAIIITDQLKTENGELREFLKLVKQEVDVCICDCGAPWIETDLADYTYKLLKKENFKELLKESK